MDKRDDAAGELLIREVEEELRKEKLNSLWKRYGGLAIGGAVAVVLAVAGWQGWNAWQTEKRQQASLDYAEALAQDGANPDQSRQILSRIATEGPQGYGILAEMRLADMAVRAGDTAAAIAAYDKVARSDAPALYRDLARLKAAYLRLDTDAAAAAAEVQALATDASPWRASAREILALAALKQGDANRAADLFRQIADDAQAPQGARARAAEMLAAAGAGKQG